MTSFDKIVYERAALEDYARKVATQFEADTWKANAERNAKIEAEKPQSDCMDIHSRRGDRIVYTGTNGHDSAREAANKCLNIGGTYTVEYVYVGNWGSLVELQELPGKRFNTVMFRGAN